jgi:hypothetical protein
MDLSFGLGFTEFVKLSPFKSSVASSDDDDKDDDSSLTRSLSLYVLESSGLALFFYAGMLTLLNFFFYHILQIFVVG